MHFFVTGTDTNVGKTVICVWLVHHLKADYWKPIQTGTIEGYDSHTIKNLIHLSDSRIHPESYSFKAPLSPYTAAALENTIIDINKIHLPKTDNALIIEGAGGVMVPINQNTFMIDLMVQLNLPVIIVARSGLGTINHTCLTINALRQRNLPIAGVILNGPLNEDNKKSIEYYGEAKVLAQVEPFNPLSFENIMAYSLPDSLLTAL